MSGIWHITAIFFKKGFAITATAGALFSISTGIGVPAPFAAFMTAPSEQTPSETSPSETSQNTTEPSASPASTDLRSDYEQAMIIANQAVVAYQSAQSERDLTQRSRLTAREVFLWRVTIQKLAAIPEQDSQYEQAALKWTQYKGLLANAQRALEATDSAILKSLIEAANVDASPVHVTICQIPGSQNPSSRPISSQINGQLSSTIGHISQTPTRWASDLLNSDRCRHHQGDVPMASPASLIKLPIAIATIDKADQENIPFSQKIYIDPSNFTENAEGASVEVDRYYSLEQVVTRMINESNNIATNQLIDYVGREAIAKTLISRGYADTLVDHKLAGDRILPPNPGTVSNQATSNDITAMVASIYSLENPGNDMLLKATASQRDHELGHQALEGMGPDIEWLGEKTGQNNRLIGSTLAMRIGSQRYALTVAIDHSGDPQAVRDIIQAVARHLLNTDTSTD